MRLIPKLLAAFAIAGLAACAAPAPQMTANPYPPPPMLRTDIMPKPPISEVALTWQPGHWDWSGAAYVWREGAWVNRNGQGTQWLPGFWSNASGAWTWIPAHWL